MWITCEDISPNLGCYGDPCARTPALDRLAAQGVRYTNAYAI
ncbi:MAG: sulfatase-like hydrolase/transferase, partial [Burkholderiales bacterium]|nr:sulfatase-like hydrolase/transferase [Burkholderiales bacterium]